MEHDNFWESFEAIDMQKKKSQLRSKKSCLFFPAWHEQKKISGLFIQMMWM